MWITATLANPTRENMEQRNERSTVRLKDQRSGGSSARDSGVTGRVATKIMAIIIRWNMALRHDGGKLACEMEVNVERKRRNKGRAHNGKCHICASLIKGLES